MEPWMELPSEAGAVDTFWPLLLVIATPVALAMLLALCASVFAATRLVREVLSCPLTGREVVLESEMTWDAERVDVSACTAFHPATAITCDKACLLRRRHRVALS